MAAQPPLNPPTTSGETKRIPGEAHLDVTLGLLTIAGGVAGYAKSKSMPSLIGGIGIGASYLYSAKLLRDGEMANGHLMAAITSGALMTVMGRRFTVTNQFMPAGMLACTGGIAGAYHFKKFADWSE